MSGNIITDFLITGITIGVILYVYLSTFYNMLITGFNELMESERT